MSGDSSGLFSLARAGGHGPWQTAHVRRRLRAGTASLPRWEQTKQLLVAAGLSAQLGWSFRVDCLWGWLVGRWLPAEQVEAW